MRVAYLASQYPAASHTFISREVAAVRASGCEVHTFSVRPPAADELRSDADRAEHASTTYLLPPRPDTYLLAHARVVLRHPRRYVATLRTALRHRVPGARAFVYAFVYFAEAVVLAGHLRRRRVERLHNHFANAGAIVGMLAAELAGVRWSLTLHGISETDYPAGNLLARKIEAADSVACVSQFGRAQASRLVAPEQWPKLSLVRCGIDLDAVVPVPIADRDSHEPVRLVCVARLSPEKGLIGLVSAYASIARTLPPSRLTLVGDGPERAALVEHVRRLGVGDLVELRGRVSEEEALAAIAESDMLVLASFMEGLPVVLMEALAIGRPVIAPRVAGIPELVVDGRHGLLFTPGAWDELADRMAHLIGDARSRRALGADGPARARELCDAARSAAELTAMWRASENGDGWPEAVRCVTVSAPLSGMETWLRSLVASMGERDDVDVVGSVWMTRPPHERLARLPPLSLHWWLSGWWSTVVNLRSMRRQGVIPDVVVVNHLSPLVMFGRISRRAPIVLNLDATPQLTATMARHYLGRDARPPWAERLKVPFYGAVYRRAAHIVAWSEVVRRSLVDDYGIDGSRVTVIANGIDVTAWQPPSDRSGDTVRVLFVGADFERKGGGDLLAVAASPEMAEVQFDVVTKADIEATPANVVVHRDLDAASGGLRDLYRHASVFVLPTYADFSPNVLCEAMATGVPAISTAVGSISEMVVDGRNGYVVAPGDRDALRDRLTELLRNPDLRQRMGCEARQMALRSFDIRRNAADFAAVLRGVRHRKG